MTEKNLQYTPKPSGGVLTSPEGLLFFTAIFGILFLMLFENRSDKRTCKGRLE